MTHIISGIDFFNCFAYTCNYVYVDIDAITLIQFH